MFMCKFDAHECMKMYSHVYLATPRGYLILDYAKAKAQISFGQRLFSLHKKSLFLINPEYQDSSHFKLRLVCVGPVPGDVKLFSCSKIVCILALIRRLNDCI